MKFEKRPLLNYVFCNAIIINTKMNNLKNLILVISMKQCVDILFFHLKITSTSIQVGKYINIISHRISLSGISHTL